MADPIFPVPPVRQLPLPYIERLLTRDIASIDLVVIHCTELPDLATARSYGEQVRYDSGAGNSGHYYIDRDGSIDGYVPIDRIAHHVRGYNPRSIGIELVNLGRYPHWWDSRHQTMHEPYPPAQIAALRQLLAWLKRACPSLRYLAGHEELDRERIPASDDPTALVQRKLDPGLRFPWPQVLSDGDWQRLPPAA
jgi:N-acetylmuramoyl-L-alanine amidase